MALVWTEKWKMVKELPGGGQAKAYTVTSLDHDKPVFFLKQLREDRSERRARMHREIACYETLSHPNIPKLLDSNAIDFNNEKAQPYLVTEYIEGTNLHDYIQRKKVCSAQEAIEITCKLLEVVEYIHSQDTVHRDIKPENIILKYEDPSSPILVDFGMSYYETEDDEKLTPPGQEVT